MLIRRLLKIHIIFLIEINEAKKEDDLEHIEIKEEAKEVFRRELFNIISRVNRPAFKIST